MTPSELIALGITLAEGVTKIVLAIQASQSMNEAEKKAAILRIRGQLLTTDDKVQSTTL